MRIGATIEHANRTLGMRIGCNLELRISYAVMLETFNLLRRLRGHDCAALRYELWNFCGRVLLEFRRVNHLLHRKHLISASIVNQELAQFRVGPLHILQESLFDLENIRQTHATAIRILDR